MSNSTKSPSVSACALAVTGTRAKAPVSQTAVVALNATEINFLVAFLILMYNFLLIILSLVIFLLRLKERKQELPNTNEINNVLYIYLSSCSRSVITFVLKCTHNYLYEYISEKNGTRLKEATLWLLVHTIFLI